MAVHAAAAAGLPCRVLRRRRRPHLRAGNIPRVLQSEKTLGSLNHDELRRPADDVQEHSTTQ